MGRLIRAGDKSHRLERVPLFASCRRDELRAVAAALDEVAVDADAALLRPGQRVQELFVLAEGAAVAVDRHGGREVGSGDYFGARELLAERHAPHLVVTATPSRLFVAEQRAFLVLLERVPIVARRLLRDLAADVAAQSETAPAIVSRGDR